jgi:hypothetical protein
MFPARSRCESAIFFPAQDSGFLGDWLDGIEIQGRNQYGSLQIFYLHTPVISPLDYATLDEALAGKMIEITELSEAGQVPRIKIVTSSQRMVFLMAGEGLIGCKQNRVLNASIMVPARREIPLPNLRGARQMGIPKPEILQRRELVSLRIESDDGR